MLNALRPVLVAAALTPFALSSVGCKKDDDDGAGEGDDSTGTTGGDADTGSGPSTTSPSTTMETSSGDEGVDEDTGTDDPGDVQTFRFTSMHIHDPHFYARLPFLGCRDITDSVPVQDSINEMFNAAIGEDDDGDGLLDLSLLLLFRPLDQADGAMDNVDFGVGDCTAPADGTACSPPDDFDPVESPYVVMHEGVCHEPDEEHLSPADYSPKPGTTMGPCFHAGPTDLVIDTGSLALPLQDAQIAATFDAAPAQALMTGTLRGFLTQEDAEQIELPEDVRDQLELIYVSQLLPGGCGPDDEGPGSGCNCASHDDRDGEGWWFYVDFTAERVPWTGE